MDVSDFSEKDFKDRDFGEEDLAGLAAALGMSYEIGYDVLPVRYEKNKSYTVRAWAKMKGLKSKRYAAFVYGENAHTKRSVLEIVLFRARLAGGHDAIAPRDVRRIRDEMSAHVVKNILSGCAIRISRKRRVVVPKSSSVEELRLRLAVAGGRA